MKRFALVVLCLVAPLALTSCEEELTEFLESAKSLAEPPPTAATSVVRVHATSQSYNFIRPWEKAGPSRRSGLGAVLEGGRILVTAELVKDHTYIELEKADTGEKVPATIAGLDYEANLALLVPNGNSPGFLDDMTPLQLDMSVRVGDMLEVWQLEDSGTPASTKGEVILVGVGRYFVDGSYLLRYVLRGSLQYRSGSFTLPVVKNGKLAGLLLSYSTKEQTSSVLAAQIIEHFLKDLDDGKYAGFPNIGISTAATLDEQLRKFAKIENYDGGIYVRKVGKGSSAMAAGIQEDDVILEINGHAIDSRGNYDHSDYGKVSFSHLVRGDAEVGQVVPVRLIRGGEEMAIDVELLRKPAEDHLIDPYMFDRGPNFLILGGLIFTELSLPYLKAWGDKWVTRAPFSLVHAHFNQEMYEEEGKEKLVILSSVILTPSTVGYDGLARLIVTKVNGQAVDSLADLKAALEQPTDGIHKIEFDSYPRVIYVDAQLSEAINAQFGSRLGIATLERLD